MTNTEALEKFFDGVIMDIIKEQRDLGIRNTGRSAGSMYSEVNDEQGQLFAERYLTTNFKGVGRKPGKMPPIASIEAWIAQRGLDLNPWAVAKSIAKKGTQIWRDEKEGIDIKAIVKMRQKILAKDCAKALKDQLLYGIRKAKGV